MVSRAIEEAYKTHIMQHKFPFTALFIDVPTYMVDVNVHPAKREFRFDNEKALFSAVFHAVQDALTEKEFIPDTAENYNNKQTIFTPQETVAREKAGVTDNINNVTSKINNLTSGPSTLDNIKSNASNTMNNIGTNLGNLQTSVKDGVSGIKNNF